jgi:NADPH:quinone reductase-like Zn-dependent oxidoreductase
VVLDFIAGKAFKETAEAAAYNGRIILAGGLGGPDAPLPLIEGYRKAFTIGFFYLIELTDKPDWLARAKAFILSGVKDGSLKPTIDRSFPLAQVADAHVYLESNQQFGKIIMETGVTPPAC